MLKNAGDASNLGQFFRCILSDLVFKWKQGTRLFKPRFFLIESSQLFKHENKVTVSPKVKLAQHIHVVVKWSIIYNPRKIPAPVHFVIFVLFI